MKSIRPFFIALFLTCVCHAVTFTGIPSGAKVGDTTAVISFTGATYPAASQYSYNSGGPNSGPLPYSYLALVIKRPDGSYAINPGTGPVVITGAQTSAGTQGSAALSTSFGFGCQLTQAGTWVVQCVNISNIGTYSASKGYTYSQTLSTVVASTTFFVGIAPTVSVSPTSARVLPGDTATYTASVGGNPTPTVQWYSSVNNGAWSATSGATSASYTTPAAVAGNTYQYECVATNSLGSASATATLIVPNLNPQTVAMSASQTSVTVGTPIQINATGSYTSYTFADSAGGTAGLPSGFPKTNSSSGPISFLYTFAAAGTYTLYAHAPAGGAYDASMYDVPVTIIVSKRPGDTPKVTPESASIAASDAQVFSASGGSTGNYVWSATSGVLSASSGASVSWRNGGTSTGATVSVRDDGDTTYAPSSSASATVTILAVPTTTPPQFTAQPADQVITYGQNASFSALASGDPTPGYRWEQSSDGGLSWSVVAGAASTSLALSMPPVAASGGQYRCVATNSAGTATSNAAKLTVKPATQGPLTIAPISTRLSPGSRMDFSVTGGSTGNYSWSTSAGSLSSGTGSVSTWTAPASTGLQTVTVSDLGDLNTLPSQPVSAAIDVASSRSKQPVVTLNPIQTSTQAGLSIGFTASGGAGTGAFVWSCSAGALSGSGAMRNWTAPSAAGNATVSVYREGDASYEVSNTAISSVTVTDAGTPVLTLGANPSTVTAGSIVKLVWEGKNVLGGVNISVISAPFAYRGSSYLGTFGATGYQNLMLDVAGTYQFQAQAPVQGLYALATVVVTPPATTKMISLVPVASTATINGRSYNRLWSDGSAWYAYLARSGLGFTATGQGENAVSAFELQAKSPAPLATFQTIATVAVSGVTNGPGVSVSQAFSGLMIDVPSGENPLVPASLASGAPLTGVWLFRARVQDSKGAWSAYSNEVPVTAALPIVTRGDTLQSHPPAGPEGAWFVASAPKAYSFQLWIP